MIATESRQAPADNVPPTVPLAVESAVLAMGQRVELDRDGAPRQEWWYHLAYRIGDDVERTLDRYEPWASADVHVVTRDRQLKADERRLYPGEDWIRIVVRSGVFWRTYHLRWLPYEVRLDPVSDDAWREMWRSLYAPTICCQKSRA